MLALSAGTLALSCATAPLPRETTASVGRTDDPWLVGDPCPPGGSDITGFRIEELAASNGRPVHEGETVRVHYTASLASGQVLHDTHDGGPPIELVVGNGKTICGFNRAIDGMRAGAQRRVSVPWQLAFGEGGRTPDVPPRTDLVFVVDLYLPADAPELRGSPPPRPAGGGAGGGMRRR